MRNAITEQRGANAIHVRLRILFHSFLGSLSFALAWFWSNGMSALTSYWRRKIKPFAKFSPPRHAKFSEIIDWGNVRDRFCPENRSNRSCLRDFWTVWNFRGRFLSKLWTAVYPPRKAPIGAKLRQNTFQTNCNFSVFNAENSFLDFFAKKLDFFFQETGVLEELGFFDPRWQIRRQKLLPEVPLLFGRLPWRWGKLLNMCRNPGLGTENDFNHLLLWSGDDTITW